MSWSPFKPEVMADPATGHQHLLQSCPVHHCAEFEPPFFTLSRYEDVEAALRDYRTFSSHYGQGPRFTEPQGLLSDPPQHTRYRTILQQAFTPRAMTVLEPQVIALTGRLVDALASGPAQFDLHDAFAFPLPVTIIADMLGVPAEDLETFKHWSDVQVAAMGAADPSIYAEDQQAFFSYLQSRLKKRREALAAQADVPDDLLTLIAREVEDVDDAQSMLQQLLVGGNETTTSLITNAVWRLLQHPEQWQALIEEPDLADAAIEESLRFDPPVLGLYRNTTREVTLHGTTIPKGAKVLINYAAANRDGSVFDAPDQFDIRRPRKRHMSFGLGIHMCLGAPMARMEATIALRALAEQIPQLSLVSDGERIAPFFLWGRKTLPLLRLSTHSSYSSYSS